MQTTLTHAGRCLLVILQTSTKNQTVAFRPELNFTIFEIAEATHP